MASTLAAAAGHSITAASLTLSSSSSNNNFTPPTLQCTFQEWSRQKNPIGLLRIFSTISVLTVLVVIVVLGNALVIAAVLLRRRLRSATGLLILSLGVADLLVGIVILPFSIANEVLTSFWIFGETWCTIWLTADIWLCTASIYNLVAISIDRYIAIIKPLNYPMLVTKFRARCIVACVWVLSFIICTPSFILASTSKPENVSPEDACKCTPAHAGPAYIKFSASSSFYLPMAIVIFVYARIYIAARNATKSVYSGMMQVSEKANKNAKSYLMSHPGALGSAASAAAAANQRDNVPMLRVHRGSSIANSYRKNTNAGASPRMGDVANLHRATTFANGHSYENNNGERKSMDSLGKKRNSAESPDSESSPTHGKPSAGMEIAPWNQTNGIAKKSRWLDKTPLKNGPLGRLLKRAPKKKAGCAYEKRLSLEIKAAKTVAIVTGCFIFCWLGFAIMYGFDVQGYPMIWSILFWLGYLNSALNPVIYTVFNREFRLCFKRLLTCHRVNAPSTHNKSTFANNNSYNSTIRATTTSQPAVPRQPPSALHNQHHQLNQQQQQLLQTTPANVLHAEGQVNATVRRITE